MARAGLGIALLPHYLCAASLARGDLVALLPSWTAAPARIYAVMPARRGTPLACGGSWTSPSPIARARLG